MADSDAKDDAVNDSSESAAQTSASKVLEHRPTSNEPASVLGHRPATAPLPRMTRAPLPPIPKLNMGEAVTRAGRPKSLSPRGESTRPGTFVETKVQGQGRRRAPQLQIDTYVDDEIVADPTGAGAVTGVAGEQSFVGNATHVGEQTAVGEVTQIPTHVQVLSARHHKAEESAVETWMGSKLSRVGDVEAEGDERTVVEPDLVPALEAQALQEGGSGDVTNIVSGIPEIVAARNKLRLARQAGAEAAVPPPSTALAPIEARLPVAEPPPVSERALTPPPLVARPLSAPLGGAESSSSPVQAIYDEGSRGFPLPPPVNDDDDADEDHTEVQTGLEGVKFQPHDYGLGPGFHRVEATAPGPESVLAQRRPLPGVQVMPTPKAPPVVKSVPIPAAWDSSAAQEVQGHRNLPPQEVALAQRLGSLTGMIKLPSKSWTLLVGLLIVVTGVLGAALFSHDRGTTKSRRGAAPEQPTLPSQVVERPADELPDAQTETVEAVTPADVEPPEPPEPELPSDAGPALVEPAVDTAAAKEFAKRGRTLFKKGKLPAALKFYEKAVAADPNYALVHRDIGQLYQRGGEWEQAVASYKLYLELAPQAKDASQLRKTIRRLRRR